VSQELNHQPDLLMSLAERELRAAASEVSPSAVSRSDAGFPSPITTKDALL
jgi:hypothetical protein